MPLRTINGNKTALFGTLPKQRCFFILELVLVGLGTEFTEENSQDDYGAFDDQLRIRGNAEQIHDVRDERENQNTDYRERDASLAAFQRDAADDTGGNGRERIVAGGEGRGAERCAARGEYPRQRGQSAADDVN